MTLRTYRYFACPHGHNGEERTSENDQSYSSPWESVATGGLSEVDTDACGYATYECATCGDPMSEKNSFR